MLLLAMAGEAVARAADGVPVAGTNAASPLSPPTPPVPLSQDWVPGFLLVLVWLLAAAAMIGPVVRYFRCEPRASQAFSDDPPPRIS